MKIAVKASVVLVVLLALLTAGAAGADEGDRRPRQRCPQAGAFEGVERPARLRTLQRRFDYCVRLNEVQVLASHNSYHTQARPELFAAIAAFDPGLASTLEYDHAPLAVELGDYGVRQVELDVFADPEGGLYGNRAGLRVIGQDPIGPPALFEPGFKVLHVQDIDFESTCLSLVACLETIDAWSRSHPGHLPITVQIEPKDDVLPDLGLGFVTPIPIRGAELDALDAEIRSVFDEDRLLTPDAVRGGRSSLEKAVRNHGWPTLRKSRGKVLFALDSAGPARDAYVAGHPSLEGRVMFTNSPPGTPEAAYVVRNDPIADGGEISDLVARGYLVRTRADADTVQARTGDTTMREAALASGAQFVTTDYPVPDPDFGTGYSVSIPGGSPARCNPVNAPDRCRSDRLEPAQP
ncbi:MAG: phosphatidylinositol-specific phospholipase C1-like protein [Acidimicrobiia bacterium]|nr:phosphatidylinositol-specific phospholipase C1-like protein [Acidimicrobiia bacterium]